MVELDATNWWFWGNYDGTSCKNCGRERVMNCTTPDETERRVCEKCEYDQEKMEHVSCLYVDPDPFTPFKE